MGRAGSDLPYPVPLFALAPPLGNLMRPPGAMLTIAEFHLHAVLAAPAFGLCLLGLILCGKALEQCFQPCQQALFVAIPQGHLHPAASQGDMDIAGCRSLGQCWGCLTLWLPLGWLGR